MRRLSKLYLMLIAILVSSALVMGALISCGDDPVPVQSDGPVVQKKDGSTPVPDKYVYPDIPKPDRTIYPDIRKPADVRPWIHAEGYTGGTFGCLSDSDCFGQLCCKTPWGVNLCAPACE